MMRDSGCGSSSRGSKLAPRFIETEQEPLVRTSALLDELKSFASDLDFVRDISMGQKH